MTDTSTIILIMFHFQEYQIANVKITKSHLMVGYLASGQLV